MDSIKIKTKYLPGMEPLRCSVNVAKAIQRHGGNLVTGWNVGGTVVAELQHHAVWQDSEGNLWDVTPKIIGTTGEYVASLVEFDSEIDFIPDPEATFPEVGCRRTRYEPMVADPKVYEACKLLAEADHFVYVKGDLRRAKRANDKANRLLKQFGGFFHMHPQHIVDKTVVAATASKATANSRERRRRKKLERRRKKANR